MKDLFLPVTVPDKLGGPPYLELSLTIDELLVIIRRHLERSSNSGDLSVSFRVERLPGSASSGLTTTIHATPSSEEAPQ